MSLKVIVSKKEFARLGIQENCGGQMPSRANVFTPFPAQIVLTRHPNLKANLGLPSDRMSKRKGLSVDDKRKKILALYHDRQEPFNLKELESLGTKEGVVQQTIKEVNQSLIDDNLVCTDKIGAANFFWSFPKKALQDQLTLNAQLIEQIGIAQSALRALEADLEASKETRGHPDRAQQLDRLAAALAADKGLDAEIDRFKYNDPEEVKKVRTSSAVCQQAANRWTDNLYQIKAFLTKKKAMASKEADKLLKIDSTFDYL